MGDLVTKILVWESTEFVNERIKLYDHLIYLMSQLNESHVIFLWFRSSPTWQEPFLKSSKKLLPTSSQKLTSPTTNKSYKPFSTSFTEPARFIKLLTVRCHKKKIEVLTTAWFFTHTFTILRLRLSIVSSLKKFSRLSLPRLQKS